MEYCGHRETAMCLRIKAQTDHALHQTESLGAGAGSPPNRRHTAWDKSANSFGALKMAE